MGKSIPEAISCLKLIQTKNASSHAYLQDIIENAVAEPVSSGPTKVLIEISLFEEIATVLTTLMKNDNKQKQVIELMMDSSEEIFKI